MIRYICSIICLAAVSFLAACGGGVEVDSSGNVLITGYVTIAPVVVSNPGPVSSSPSSLPQSCIVWEGGNTYALYGYGYYGCPQITSWALVNQFQGMYPELRVETLAYPSVGSARIAIR